MRGDFLEGVGMRHGCGVSIRASFRSVAAFVSCYCLVILAAVIVLGLVALFLLFVVLFP